MCACGMGFVRTVKAMGSIKQYDDWCRENRDILVDEPIDKFPWFTWNAWGDGFEAGREDFRKQILAMLEGKRRIEEPKEDGVFQVVDGTIDAPE